METSPCSGNGISGDKSLLRQVGGARGEIVHRLVTEIDVGKEIEKVVTGRKGEHGDEFENVSGDVWNILVDREEVEAYDKIKMVPKGQGLLEEAYA